MQSLKVLITNCVLQGRSGTEMYVYDLARFLLREGHVPIVYSPRLGELAKELLRQSIPVVDSLDCIAESPDIIHGHHTLETLSAMLYFPSAPGIFVCHDCDAWHDTPPVIPRIRRFVGVDQPCADRLSLANGIDRNKVTVLTNPVDLDLFKPRSPLPAKPKRALIFSSYAKPHSIRPIVEACVQSEIEVETVGSRMGNESAQPQALLPEYDVVFAKGRCAREAMAVGCAVVYCDTFGLGPLVTRDAVEHLNTQGRRVMLQPMTRDGLLEQIRRYDPGDAAEVSHFIRSNNRIESIHQQLLEIYGEAIAEHHAAKIDYLAESQAVARLTQWWAKQREQLVKDRAKKILPHRIAARLCTAIAKRATRLVQTGFGLL